MISDDGKFIAEYSKMLDQFFDMKVQKQPQFSDYVNKFLERVYGP